MSTLSYDTLRVLALKLKRDNENVVAALHCSSDVYMELLNTFPKDDGFFDNSFGAFRLQGVLVYERPEMSLRRARAFNSDGKLLKEIQL